MEGTVTISLNDFETLRKTAREVEHLQDFASTHTTNLNCVRLSHKLICKLLGIKDEYVNSTTFEIIKD